MGLGIPSVARTKVENIGTGFKKERQEYLELQRFFKIKENERKNMLKQEKMAKSRKNLESKLTQIRME